MKNLLKVEELFLFGLALFLFSKLHYGWGWYALLFFAPDLSMLGYLARTYLLAKLLLILLIGQLSGTGDTQQPNWFSDPLRPLSPWQLTRIFKAYLEQILVPASSFANFWRVLPALQRYFCAAPRRRLDQLAWARAFLEHFAVSTNFSALS